MSFSFTTYPHPPRGRRHWTTVHGPCTKTDPYRFRRRTPEDDENERFRNSLPDLPPLENLFG